MSAKAYRQKKSRRLFTSTRRQKCVIIFNSTELYHKHTTAVKQVSGQQKSVYHLHDTRCFGAPHRTRTCDLLIRSQTLYPAELVALIQFVLSVSRGNTYILPQLFSVVKNFFQKSGKISLFQLSAIPTQLIATCQIRQTPTSYPPKPPGRHPSPAGSVPCLLEAPDGWQHSG